MRSDRRTMVGVVSRFQSGWLCAEAVAAAVLESVGTTPTGETMRLASAFSGGVGGSGRELCGAFTGGVLALGAVLGRERPGEELHDLAALTAEFREWFLAEHGSLSCAELVASFDAEEERATACVALSAEAAAALAGMLEAHRAGGEPTTARAVLPVGVCPFRGG